MNYFLLLILLFISSCATKPTISLSMKAAQVGHVPLGFPNIPDCNLSSRFSIEDSNKFNIPILARERGANLGATAVRNIGKDGITNKHYYTALRCSNVGLQTLNRMINSYNTAYNNEVQRQNKIKQQRNYQRDQNITNSLMQMSNFYNQPTRQPSSNRNTTCQTRSFTNSAGMTQYTTDCN